MDRAKQYARDRETRMVEEYLDALTAAEGRGATFEIPPPLVDRLIGVIDLPEEGVDGWQSGYADHLSDNYQ
ncbi:DUF6364 family protein [Neolewinella marina]|uniref:DUF6364 family protein n=1 Tax=Neolewinella marina TaxID=438751 RepID=UPI0038736D26